MKDEIKATIAIAHTCKLVEEAVGTASACLSGDFSDLPAPLKAKGLNDFMVTPAGRILFYHEDWVVTQFPRVPRANEGRLSRWIDGGLYVYGGSMIISKEIAKLLQDSPFFIVPECVLEDFSEAAAHPRLAASEMKELVLLVKELDVH